jgi:hypothetical protein
MIVRIINRKGTKAQSFRRDLSVYLGALAVKNSGYTFGQAHDPRTIGNDA